MGFDLRAAEATDRMAEQTGMFALFFKPKIHQHPGCLGGISICSGISGNERGWTATIPELKLFERREQLLNNVTLQQNRQIPFGFRAILAISLTS